jgi:hypothetical protein
MATDTRAETDTEQLHTKDLVPQERTSDAADQAPEHTDVADTDQGSQETQRSSAGADAPMPLLDDAPKLEAQWSEVQVRFVDEPRRAVEDADALVAEVMRRLAETFAAEREQMEREWHAGDEVSTEDLRLAMQRYRSFFQRLLAA